MQSIIPTGLHTLPSLELTAVAQCSMQPPPSLCPTQVPSWCATFLVYHLSFSKDTQFPALKRPVPFPPPIPVVLFCSLREKSILYKNTVFRGRSQNKKWYCSYNKSSLELWRV